MLDKLIAIEAKYSQIEARLAAPETYDDPAQVARLNKEQAELAPLVETFRTYQQTLNARDQAHALLGDPEMRELAQEEYDQALKDIPRLEREIQILLLPKDPNDNKNVIVEIRAGVGGEEAALFAAAHPAALLQHVVELADDVGQLLVLGQLMIVNINLHRFQLLFVYDKFCFAYSLSSVRSTAAPGQRRPGHPSVRSGRRS